LPRSLPFNTFTTLVFCHPGTVATVGSGCASSACGWHSVDRSHCGHSRISSASPLGCSASTGVWSCGDLLWRLVWRHAPAALDGGCGDHAGKLSPGVRAPVEPSLLQTMPVHPWATAVCSCRLLSACRTFRQCAGELTRACRQVDRRCVFACADRGVQAVHQRVVLECERGTPLIVECVQIAKLKCVQQVLR
jgi:hypothetical protein